MDMMADTQPEWLGWNYYVQEPKPVRFVKKTYADNFKHCPGKLRLIRTK